MPDGTTEIDRGDPARGEKDTATAMTPSPGSLARYLVNWIASRD